ncbi:MAG TPA: MlaD family protein [Candidatus Binatia bacterium]|jgi:paraquat-inducible protein B
MSKKSNPAAIGAFVIGAIALGIIGLTVFGSGRYFRETYKYILYFESDVSGLSVGANVKLKGVQIGTVTSVLLGVGDMAQLSGPREKFYVPVIIELDAEKTASLGAQAKPNPETINALVMRGLRAQLASESLVTGVLYVKLDLFPLTKGLRLGDELGAPYPEIPTLPTPFEEVQLKAAQFFADLQRIDVEGLVENFKATLASANDILQSQDLKAAIAHLDETMNTLDQALASFRDTSDTARAVLDPLRKDLEPTLADLRSTLVELRGAAKNTGSVLQPDSPLVVALQKTLDDAQTTAKTVKDLAALLERQPDALLKGKGEPKVKPQ